MPPICQDYQKREWRGGGGESNVKCEGREEGAIHALCYMHGQDGGEIGCH